MHFFRRFTSSKRQDDDAKSAPNGTVNQGIAIVTPTNQQQHPSAQQRLLQAPRGFPRLPPRAPARRRHFSDNSIQGAVQDRQPRANQNQRQPPASGFSHLFARGLLEFASGYQNLRMQHRRLLQTKSLSSNEVLSMANPLGFANSFENTIRPSKFDAVLSMPPLSDHELKKHSWNPSDKSPNIIVREDDTLTFHRLPVAQSTDCIRGRVGYSRGFHVWEMHWPVLQRGTHPVVGVATKDAPLQKTGYSSLVGSNSESYGWDINKNRCYHDSALTRGWAYPDNSSIGSNGSFKLPDKFYCILDMDEGFMAFATEDKYLGIAFKGLKGKTLYPIVSAVWGHCEIRMQYFGGFEPMPRKLMDLCRRTIRARVPAYHVRELSLAPRLHQYLVYKW